jgi:two-component system, cell cycle sensor histidine kinase and response regulator CckA
MAEATQLYSRALEGSRVLVVDDSDSTRVVLGGILKRCGAEVYEAASGPEAIMMAKAMPLALTAILLDMVMNEMDGIETANVIAQWVPNGKAIIVPMGASIGSKVKERLHEVGIHAEPLHKPYNPAQVVGAVLAVAGGLPGSKDIDSSLPPSTNRDFPIPKLEGVDIRGALDRCLDDSNLLRRVLLDCQCTSRAGLYRSVEAVRASDFKMAYQILHKYRGELLNLGMVQLVEQLVSIQSSMAEALEENSVVEEPTPALVRTQPLQPEQLRSLLASQIEKLSDRLDDQIAQYLSLPFLRVGSSRVLARPESMEKAVDASVYQTLIANLRERNANALNIIKTVNRVMPLRYSSSVEQIFRQRIEALDFELALSLLDSTDLALPANSVETKRSRILLVEKAPLTIRLLANIIFELGEIRFARNALEALSVAESWTPDLLLVGVDLDGHSGIDLCRKFKSSGAVMHAPVILMSSSNDTMTEILGLTAGAIDFIEMPIMPARVLGRIRGHLAAASALGVATARNGRVAPREFERLSGFMVADLAGTLLAVSPDLARFLGGETKYLGERLVALFRGEDAQRVTMLHTRALELGRSEATQVYVANPSGEKLPIRVSGRKVTSESGSIVWISCESDVDIVLEQAQLTHKEVAKVMATLSGGIAHEFNNQLSIIIGNIDLALECASLAEATKTIQRARDAALRLAVTSRSMGEASLRRGQPAGLPERVDKLIDRYWGVWKSSVPGNVTFNRQPMQKECWVRMASDDLRWCIASLIENAVDAMPKGGQLTLACHLIASDDPHRRGLNDIGIELTDNGVGMDSATLAKACQPFFTTKQDHSGLGLSQVAWAVESAGGRLDIDSTPGRGTSATIRLPAAEG